jgi:hypothetical protein
MHFQERNGEAHELAPVPVPQWQQLLWENERTSILCIRCISG